MTISSAWRGLPPRSTSEASTNTSASTSRSQRYGVCDSTPKIQFAAASTATPAATPAIIVQIAELRRSAG